MADTLNVAVVGANGVVGKVLLELLEQREFPLAKLYCLGYGGIEDEETALFKSKNYPLLPFDGFDFSQVDIAIFTDVAGTEVELAVTAAKAGAMVITNQPAFAYASDIPLVVAGINDEALAESRNHNIIAVPDASSTLALQVLKPVYDEVGLSAVGIVALEAVSSFGEEGIKELAGQTAKLLNAKPIESKVFAKQIAFNVVPMSGELMESGYTRNESGQIHAIQKVMSDHALEVDASILQVPVFFGHTLDLSFDSQQALGVEQLRKLWQRQKHLHWVGEGVATAVSDAAESEQIFISRVRASAAGTNRFRLTVVADNIRLGQADNMVKIAQILAQDYL